MTKTIEGIKQVLVIGAGTMGHAIAQVYAQSGFKVDLVDLKPESLEQALEKIKMNLNLLLKYNKIERNEIEETLNRMTFTTDLEPSAKSANIVVEVVNEDKDVKRAVYNTLNNYCSEDTIFASNTSDLNIFNIVSIKNPERLIIHHYFRPAYISPLVEVVAGKKTSQEVIELSMELMKKLGKKPIFLKKYTPGFIVNKIQMAINSAIFTLLLKGVASPEDIDLAIKTTIGIRLPIVGIVQNMDFVGLDTISDVLKNIGVTLSIINEKIDKGYFGIKTSQGLYDYHDRSEMEILKQHDELCLKNLKFFEENIGFDAL